MGKRKQAAPQRASAEKRNLRSWNMADVNQGSVDVIADNDPSLQQETLATQEYMNSAKSVEDVSQNEATLRKDDLTDIFDLHVENCLFSINIYKEPIVKKNVWSCVLAEFTVQFSPGPLFLPLPVELPDTSQFCLHVGKEGEKSIFWYNSEKSERICRVKGKFTKQVVRDIKFWMVDVSIPLDCLQALKCRDLQIVLESFSKDTMTMVMRVLGTEAVLSKLSCPGEPVRPKGVNRSLQTLMEHFYRIVAPDYDDLPYSRKHDIDELYCIIKQRHSLNQCPILPDVQHTDLLPQLRLYQQAGITWMLGKERQEGVCKNGDIHILYTEIVTKDGQTLYFNKHSGVMVRDRPLLSAPAPGGILGDEMGLGKTVEVLACILHHPRDYVPLQHPLPVVEDEEILPTKRKGKERKSRKKKKVIYCEDSDSDETIIYADNDQSDVLDVSHDCVDQLLDKTAMSCDYVDNSDANRVTTNVQASQDTRTTVRLPDVNQEHVNGSVTNEKCIGEMAENFKMETSTKSDESQVNDQIGSDMIPDISKTDDLLQDSKLAKIDNDSEDGKCNIPVTEDFQTGYKNIFTEMPGKREEFECICGAMKASTRKHGKKRLHPVQCVLCGLWQHAECVNYDLKDPYRGDFKCPHCHVSSSPVVSGATLIISPSSIAHQWVEETLKHVAKESLNVFMYTGVNKQGFIQPQTLARQDIVITTYETLRKEIDYVDLPHCNSDSGRKLRYPKRFMALPSPIVAVEWWRICLDEAQMVECTTTKTAEMALRLTAVNRWCVTGTPIQKGIDDLYGLMLFLGVDPYWVQQWWQQLVYEPFCRGIREPMYNLLTSVLWRTVKNDVLEQINIPAQTEHLQWLTFSPVEEHFYRRQYRDCVKLSMERLSKWTDSSTKLSSLDRHTVSQLLYPLVRLRQACCHPQAVRGEFLPINKSTMTMEELLESLTKKARQEAEESHRALVASINGQAGLHTIKEEFVEAVEKYREVLRSVEEHKDKLHTDSLQQLHAMYNLREILSSKPKGVGPTLRDDMLETQIAELKDKYMAKAIAFLKSTEEALAPVQIEVKQQLREVNDGTEWWIDVIQWSERIYQDDLLMQKVRDDLGQKGNEKLNTLLRGCRNSTGLMYAMEHRLSGMHKAYQAVLKAMKDLSGPPSTDLINKTVECCLRPVAEILNTCPFCKSKKLFEEYEANLFYIVEKGLELTMNLKNEVNARRVGSWADSEVVTALKSILSFAKQNKAPEELTEFGTAHIKLIDALQKEYKKMSIHYAGMKEHVGSFDELDMCTTRLRLRFSDEPVPETPQLNVLDRSELAQHKLQLASDRIVANGELRKKLGQLLYLTNLAKNQENNKEGDNPEPCPICQNEFGREWSVMQCGHCYCLECIRVLVERASFGRRNFSVKCAVCRQNTHHSEISYVTTKTEHALEDEETRVLGSHSTKVEAIVRCLLKIKKDDPSAKSLIFSTWTDVLSVIAKALDENSISYKALYASGKFQQNLSAFKQSDDVTTLLLPVHSGANGLNLIEATNVLLVEPILNLAQELQAIGRVHRIGQTRPTNVYRFLVRGTIEQKMQVLLKSMDFKNTPNNSEESGLTIGDLSLLFTQQLEDDYREGVQSMDESDTSSPTSDREGPNLAPRQGPSAKENSGDYGKCGGIENSGIQVSENNFKNIPSGCNVNEEIASTSFATPTFNQGSLVKDDAIPSTSYASLPADSKESKRNGAGISADAGDVSSIQEEKSSNYAKLPMSHVSLNISAKQSDDPVNQYSGVSVPSHFLNNNTATLATDGLVPSPNNTASPATDDLVPSPNNTASPATDRPVPSSKNTATTASDGPVMSPNNTATPASDGPAPSPNNTVTPTSDGPVPSLNNTATGDPDPSSSEAGLSFFSPDKATGGAASADS